jgi:hypothetical protein
VRIIGRKFEWLRTFPPGWTVLSGRSAAMNRRICAFLTNSAWAALAVLLLLGPTDAQAQLPGEIRGTIRDTETGEFLDYANVLIKGSTRGTMSLGGGAFFFKGLPPGEYTIQVLYLGYAPEEQTILLQPGQTANLKFDMKVVIVETLGAFDVDAEVYMVEIKNTAAEQKID